MAFENHYWLCQNALAVLFVLSALPFRAINDFEKHPVKRARRFKNRFMPSN